MAKKSFWQKIRATGVLDTMPLPLQHRIRLSNQLGIVTVVVSLFMAIWVAVNGKFTPAPPIALASFAASVHFLNRFGFHKASRLIISIAPILALLAMNLSIKFTSPENIGVVHYISPRMLMLATIVLPLTLFTATEKLPIYLGAGLILSIVFSYNLIHEQLFIHETSLQLPETHRGTVLEDLVLMLVVILGSFLFLLYNNQVYEKYNQNLLKEAALKNQALNAREQELQEYLRQIEEGQTAQEKRTWITKGLADFSVTLRQQGDFEENLRVLLSQIVQYIGAQQGGFYLVQEDQEGRSLELIACYAYDRFKYIEQSIPEGEGLLGQCLRDGEKVMLTEIPENYTTIPSGLGQAPPRCVLILPMKMAEKTECVLELAIFEPLADHKIEFLEKLAENIAGTVAGYRMNSRTQTLLDQTQRISDELREKEAEMRQNMEELQATQEQLARKEQEYLKRIAELEGQLSKA